MQDRSDEGRSLRTPSPLRSRTAKSPGLPDVHPAGFRLLGRRVPSDRKGNTVSCSSARGISRHLRLPRGAAAVGPNLTRTPGAALPRQVELSTGIWVVLQIAYTHV